jgi:hypothetical protein
MATSLYALCEHFAARGSSLQPHCSGGKHTDGLLHIKMVITFA